MKKVLITLICVLSAICTVAVTSYGCEDDTLIPLDGRVADDVLRFHIIANSDSATDQRLKYIVRDAVAGKVADDLRDEGIGDKSSAEAYVSEHMNRYINEARKALCDNGCSYSVTGTVGRWWFPVKIYGSYIFPEGEYDAVRLMIGKAEGKNWWCVLFPSLCVVDDAYQVIGDEEEKEDEENKNVKIRFRIVEWIQDMW